MIKQLKLNKFKKKCNWTSYLQILEINAKSIIVYFFIGWFTFGKTTKWSVNLPETKIKLIWIHKY